MCVCVYLFKTKALSREEILFKAKRSMKNESEKNRNNGKQIPVFQEVERTPFMNGQVVIVTKT